jgi:hypothetical protein
LAQLFQLPQQVRLNSAGTPYAAAKAYFYRVGTTTPQDVYTTPSLTVAHSQPVVADSAGQWLPIWLDTEADYDYRVVITTAGAVQLDDYEIARSSISSGQLSDALTRPIIGAALYPRTAAEQAAGVTPSTYYFPPGDVRRYGAIGNDITNDAVAVQAAITQSQQTTGDAWMVPYGVACAISTTLTNSAASRGVVDGQLRHTGNFDLLSNTADNFVVTGRGKFKGYGTFFPSGADNASLIKSTGSDCVVDGLTFEDYPQYGVLFRSSTAVGGRLANITLIGGPLTYTQPQHYGIEIEGLFRGLQIDNIQGRPNAAGGRLVQGVASGFLSSTQPSQCNVSNVHIRAPHDHGLYFYTTKSTVENITVSDAGGSGIRVIGPNNTCGNFSADNCTGGGVDFLNAAGSTLDGVSVKDHQAIGISVELHDSGANDQMSGVTITNFYIDGKASDTDVRCGIRVQSSYGGSAYSQSNINISQGTIRRASQSSTAEGAIQIQVGPGAVVSRLKLKDVTIDECGYNGIQVMGGGTLRDSEIEGNTIRQPGTHASAATTDTHGIRVVPGTTMEYGSVVGNTCRDDAGAPKMEQGYSVGGTATLVRFDDTNQSFGHTSAPGSFLANGDYTNGDTTPSVRNRRSLHITNSGGTIITNLDDGVEGQMVTLTFADSNTDINRDNCALSGGTDFTTITALDSITLIKRGSQWIEVCRSANA